MKKLAYVSKEKIEILKEIGDEEYSLVARSIDCVFFFERKISQKMKITDIISEIIYYLSIKKTTKIERLVSEYYNNFRSFLDYWETTINRDFGLESDEFKSFKNATNLEYDNSFFYRFSYEMRNYIQHCGFPNIIFNSFLNSENIVENRIDLFTKDVIDGFNWKKKVRNDLHLIKKINMVDSFIKTEGSINRINNIAINFYDLENLIRSAKIVRQYREFFIDDCNLALLNMPLGYPKNLSGELSIKLFPFDKADLFLDSLKPSK